MKKSSLLAFLLAAALLALSPLSALAAADVTAEAGETAAWLGEATAPLAAGDALAVLGLVRGGYLNPAQPEATAFARAVIEQADAAPTAREAALQALALASLGLDPAVHAPALLQRAADADHLRAEGLPAAWAALQLFGPADVAAPAGFDPAVYALEIARTHNADGGFGGEGVSNPLDTSLAVCLLAPYQEANSEIAEASLNGQFYQQLYTNDFGGYSLNGAESLEATAYAMLSVDALGYDPAYISWESAPMTDFLHRYRHSGGFYSYSETPDEELTALCLLALVAKLRYDRGKTALFDFSDVVPVELPVEAPAQGTGSYPELASAQPGESAVETQASGPPALLVVGLVAAVLLGLVVLVLLYSARGRRRR